METSNNLHALYVIFRTVRQSICVDQFYSRSSRAYMLETVEV